ncbi:MAG: 1,4-dihydroxy-2-naphthoate octaprenyltransferase [Gammaproteobacteria bacterium]|nr:1,4-dihydroxy-2-naphthoate octaprenyltransferase [Gammaproteobacteria bacterium]
MATDIVETAGPDTEKFAGASLPRTAKRLFHATRPKFFPASVLPVLAGSAWGLQIAGQFDFVVFALALLATVCVHAGANVLNDVGDDAGGTDRQNEDRIYPYTGGSRFIQVGIMSARGMARLGISLLTIAALAGLLLLTLKGEMILWFGLAGLLLAVLYSLGPVRLSSIGLGEIAVAAAFGVIPVTGAAWLQSGIIDANVILFALPISAWVTAILLINEVPDIDADGSTGKKTLPVRVGLGGTAVLYVAIHAFAVAAVIWLVMRGGLPGVAAIVPVLLLLMGIKAAAAIRAGVNNNRAGMTGAIEATLGIHTLGSLWLAGCALFAAFWGS